MQLTFQPALDPFHAAFRMIRLLPIIEKHASVHEDIVRILDFYLLFPFRIDDIRLSPAHRRFKKLSKIYSHHRPYGQQPEPQIILERMHPMQGAALETLASENIIDSEALRSREVKLGPHAVPALIANRVVELNSNQSDLMEFLGVLASDYELAGEGGLKARTGLLEHRYDAV